MENVYQIDLKTSQEKCTDHESQITNPRKNKLWKANICNYRRQKITHQPPLYQKNMLR